MLGHSRRSGYRFKSEHLDEVLRQAEGGGTSHLEFLDALIGTQASLRREPEDLIMDLAAILKEFARCRWDFRFVRTTKTGLARLWSERERTFIAQKRFIAENTPPMGTIRQASDVSDGPFDMTHVTEMRILNRRIWKELKKSLPEG